MPYNNSIYVLCLFWLILGMLIITQFVGLHTSPVNRTIEKTNTKNTTTEIIIQVPVDLYPLTLDMKIASKFIRKINKRTSKSIADKIAFEVYTQAYREGVSPELILGIIKVESYFNPAAYNKSGASGLMQVLNGGPGIHVDPTKIFNIDYNIKKGIEIFKEHKRIAGGDINKALFGYVGGDKNYVTQVKVAMSNFIMFNKQQHEKEQIETIDFNL